MSALKEFGVVYVDGLTSPTGTMALSQFADFQAAFASSAAVNLEHEAGDKLNLKAVRGSDNQRRGPVASCRHRGLHRRSQLFQGVVTHREDSHEARE